MSSVRQGAATTARPRIYPSRVDWWIAWLLMLPPLLVTFLAMYAWFDGNPNDALILAATAVFTVAITAMFTCPCRYTIDGDELWVRCGIIGYAVPLREIKAIEKSTSWLSGPALSRRRVKITTDRRHHLLSPKQRDEFIEQLHEAAVQAGAAMDETRPPRNPNSPSRNSP